MTTGYYESFCSKHDYRFKTFGHYQGEVCPYCRAEKSEKEKKKKRFKNRIGRKVKK